MNNLRREHSMNLQQHLENGMLTARPLGRRPRETSQMLKKGKNSIKKWKLRERQRCAKT